MIQNCSFQSRILQAAASCASSLVANPLTIPATRVLYVNDALSNMATTHVPRAFGSRNISSAVQFERYTTLPTSKPDDYIRALHEMVKDLSQLLVSPWLKFCDFQVRLFHPQVHEGCSDPDLWQIMSLRWTSAFQRDVWIVWLFVEHNFLKRTCEGFTRRRMSFTLLKFWR